MKKRLCAALLAAAAALTFAAPQTMAAESWRDAFITRLMRAMSSYPEYSDVVLTDLDHNGIPEAFLFRNSVDGGISEGFTMKGNTVTNLTVPKDIIGTCLTDLTVYNDNGRYIFVGREIPRYTNEIYLYKLEMISNELVATKIKKEYVSGYSVIPYQDMYGNNFLTNGYPNRTKIVDFINQYEAVNNLTAAKTVAKVLVNGNAVEISGYMVDNSNYFKIRDIAMILRSTGSRFNVTWNSGAGTIAVNTGEKYTITGGELSEDTSTTLEISENTSPIYVDGVEIQLNVYTINGSSYFKIRDLGDIVGFNVDWNADEQAIVIQTR